MAKITKSITIDEHANAWLQTQDMNFSELVNNVVNNLMTQETTPKNHELLEQEINLLQTKLKQTAQQLSVKQTALKNILETKAKNNKEADALAMAEVKALQNSGLIEELLS